MPTISPTYDIKSLIEHYASIEIAYKSTVHGVLEYHSNCPFCPGSKDSFIMRPETGEWNHHTRAGGCKRKGDAIDFLMEYQRMTRAEAMDFLGLERNADFVPSSPSKSPQNGNENAPLARWQETGKLLVERAHNYLYSSNGKDMLDYLYGRGLGDEIIKKKRLGYVPLQKNGKFYESELENWGLDPETCKKDKVRIPPGILIPWTEGNTLWRLGLKRIDKNEYGQVLGSGEGLFNVSAIQYDTPAMIVESEFCQMAVEQEAGDLIACVATGSTTRGRLNKWVAELGLASYVLQSFDEDDGGDSGAEYWLQHLKKCTRWSPLVAKDPNDILLQKFIPPYQGQTLREWVAAGMQIAQEEFGIARPFVVDSSTPPCKVEESLLQKRNHLPPWTEKDKQFLEKAFSKVQVVEVDLIELSKKEYIRANLALGICLNLNCPCGLTL
jgi:hypothetical protein